MHASVRRAVKFPAAGASAEARSNQIFEFYGGNCKPLRRTFSVLSRSSAWLRRARDAPGKMGRQMPQKNCIMPPDCTVNSKNCA